MGVVVWKQHVVPLARHCRVWFVFNIWPGSGMCRCYEYTGCCCCRHRIINVDKATLYQNVFGCRCSVRWRTEQSAFRTSSTASTNFSTNWSYFLRASGTQKYDLNRRWRPAPRFLDVISWCWSTRDNYVAQFCSVSTWITKRSAPTDTQSCLASSYLKPNSITL